MHSHSMLLVSNTATTHQIRKECDQIDCLVLTCQRGAASTDLSGPFPNLHTFHYIHDPSAQASADVQNMLTHRNRHAV